MSHPARPRVKPGPPAAPQPEKREPPAASHPESGAGTDFERIVFFSDAVFAIAITLLVLQIRVPDLPPGAAPGELSRAVIGLMPSFIVYGISFLLVANYWVSHHRMFRYIHRYDTPFIWLNVVYLLCVAFLPVPSTLISRYPGEPAAVAFAAACLAIATLMAGLLWAYAARRGRLVDPGLPPDLVHHFYLRGALGVIVFGLAAGLAFANVDLARLLMIAFFLLSSLFSSLYSALMLRISRRIVGQAARHPR